MHVAFNILKHKVIYHKQSQFSKNFFKFFNIDVFKETR